MRLDRSTFQAGGAAMAGVWLVFLFYPVTALVQGPFSTGAASLGLALLLAFAVVYVLGFGWSQELQMVPRHRGLLVWFGILLSLVLAQIPLLGWMVYSYTTYLVAVLVFTFPWRFAIPGSLALLFSSFTVFLGDRPEYFWYVFGAVWMGPLVVGLVAWGDRREKRMFRLEQRAAVAEERESVARDVHDLLGHSLTVIALKSEVAERMLETAPEQTRTELQEISRLSRQALAEVRSTVTRLQSPDLAGQIRTAEQALQAAGIQARLPDPADLPPLAPQAEELFSWVLREAVTNVLRHSGASSCRVEISSTSLEVVDDGVGASGTQHGNGLAGMARRTAEAGGTLAVRPWISTEDLLEGERCGTRVMLSLPPDAPTRSGRTRP